MFELINKVIFPRSVKKTIASAVDLFLIECFSNFALINLPSLMINHMHKVINVMKGKHGIPYGYLFNKIFIHFRVDGSKGTIGTAK